MSVVLFLFLIILVFAVTCLYVTRPFAPSYGSFSSSVSQTATESAVVPITYNTVDLPSKGMSLASADSIRVDEDGVYKVLSSVQGDRTSAGIGELDMFVSVDGIAVSNSATRIAINQNTEVVMTVEWLLHLSARQRVSVSMFSATANNRLLAVAAAGAVPAIPSIITTVVRIA